MKGKDTEEGGGEDEGRAREEGGRGDKAQR